MIAKVDIAFRRGNEHTEYGKATTTTVFSVPASTSDYLKVWLNRVMLSAKSEIDGRPYIPLPIRRHLRLKPRFRRIVKDVRLTVPIKATYNVRPHRDKHSRDPEHFYFLSADSRNPFAS